MCKWRMQLIELFNSELNYRGVTKYKERIIARNFDSYAKQMTVFWHCDIKDETMFLKNKQTNALIGKVVTYEYRINVKIEGDTNDNQVSKKVFEESWGVEQVCICISNKLGKFSL
ncbi:uncharacterized protein LOC126470244 [Schistocerca serialis cubense]|uniref:uncharacterized protein LOC126470244 n=1 Tax=Schistocerca serialis cubense TaxID=2023355 RepID=UPI00214E2AC7|nr:uncharacterized protein LOC126470244 [Schistocerca serialis cubense]